MKKLNYFLSTGFLLLLLSCQKSENNDPYPTNLKDVKVSSSFSWSTSQNVQVSITGLPTINPVRSTLVISLMDGSTIYQESYEMSQSKMIYITIPAIDDSIRLKYGSVSYNLPVQEKKVEFSFIPKIEE